MAQVLSANAVGDDAKLVPERIPGTNMFINKLYKGANAKGKPGKTTNDYVIVKYNNRYYVVMSILNKNDSVKIVFDYHMLDKLLNFKLNDKDKKPGTWSINNNYVVSSLRLKTENKSSTKKDVPVNNDPNCTETKTVYKQPKSVPIKMAHVILGYDLKTVDKNTIASYVNGENFDLRKENLSRSPPVKPPPKIVPKNIGHLSQDIQDYYINNKLMCMNYYKDGNIHTIECEADNHGIPHKTFRSPKESDIISLIDEAREYMINCATEDSIPLRIFTGITDTTTYRKLIDMFNIITK